MDNGQRLVTIAHLVDCVLRGPKNNNTVHVCLISCPLSETFGFKAEFHTNVEMYM